MARPRVEYVITARDATARAFASVSSRVGQVASQFAALGAAAGVVAAPFAKLVADSARTADEVNKLSTQLGISTEALSEYQFVAQQTGVDFRQFTLGIQRATRRIAEAAQGTGEARNALKELGLSAIELNRLSPDQQFERLAEAIGGVENEADQVRLAFKLFDSEGVRLLRTIKAGSGGIAELRDEARALGLSLSQDAADGASNLVDAFGRLRSSTQGVGNALLAAVGDDVVDGLDALTDGFSNLADVIGRADQATSGYLATSQGFLGTVAALLREFQGDAGAVDALTREREKATALLAERIELQKRLSRLEGSSAPVDIAQSDAARERIAEIGVELDRLGQRAQALREQPDPLEPLTVSAQRLPELVREVGSALQEIRLPEGVERIDPFAGLDPVLAREYGQILAETALPAEELAQKLRVINELVTLGAISQGQADEQVRRLGDSFEVAAARSKKLAEELSIGEEFQKSATKSVDQFGSSLSRAFVDGTSSASDLFSNFVNDIISKAFELLVIQPIIDGIFGGLGLGGAGGSGGAGLLGSIFGKAVGGSVRSGQPYLVGEQGPELFVPATGGQIQRNAGGAVSINFNINTLDGKQAAAVIAENRNVIIGIVRDGFNRAGSRAPVV